MPRKKCCRKFETKRRACKECPLMAVLKKAEHRRLIERVTGPGDKKKKKKLKAGRKTA